MFLDLHFYVSFLNYIVLILVFILKFCFCYLEGHYLSATAQMWASTQNDRLKDKMFSIVSSLADCQKKIGSGYLSAFPSEEFDRFEAIQQVWAPYYTIHKVVFQSMQ